MLGFVKNNWFFQQDRMGKFTAGPPPTEEALPPQITTFDAKIIPNGHPLQKPPEAKPDMFSALPAAASEAEEEETSSAEEDRIEYGPGIVARLRQKFLAFATQERVRTAVKRRKARAQSCDDLLDDERASQISYENVRQMTKLSQSQTALNQQDLSDHPQPDINANYAEEKSAEPEAEMKPVLAIAQKFEPSFHIPNFDRLKKKFPGPKEPPAEPEKAQNPPEFVKVAAQLKRVPELLRRPSARIGGRSDISAPIPAKIHGYQEIPVDPKNIPRYNGLLLDIAPAGRPVKAQAPAPPTTFEPVSVATKIAAWDPNAAKRAPAPPSAPAPTLNEPPKKVLIQSSDEAPKKALITTEEAPKAPIQLNDEAPKKALIASEAPKRALISEEAPKKALFQPTEEVPKRAPIQSAVEAPKKVTPSVAPAPILASTSNELPKKALVQPSEEAPKKVEPPVVPATPPPSLPAKTAVPIVPDTFVTAKISQIRTTLDNIPPYLAKTPNGHLPSAPAIGSASSGSDSEEAPSTITTTDGSERPPRIFSPPPRSSNDPPSPAKFRALLQSFESASGGIEKVPQVPPPPHLTSSRVIPQIRRSADISPSSASTSSSEDVGDINVASNPILALRESSTTVASYGRDVQIPDAPIPIPPPDYDMKDDWSYKNGHSAHTNGEISREAIVNGHLEEMDEDEDIDDQPDTPINIEFTNINVVVGVGNLAKSKKDASRGAVGFADVEVRAYTYVHEDDFDDSDTWMPGREISHDEYQKIAQMIKEQKLKELTEAATVAVSTMPTQQQQNLMDVMSKLGAGVTNRFVYGNDSTSHSQQNSEQQPISQRIENNGLRENGDGANVEASAETWSKQGSDLLF